MAYETYKVQPGETLTEIAHRFGTTPQALVRLNSIPGPKMVKAGMEIVVPVDEAHEAAVKTAEEAQARSIAAAQAEAIAQAQAVAAAASAAGAAKTFKTIKYTMKAGETLTEVAGRYGTTPQALVRLNGIAGPKMVHEGMEIFIPDGSLGEAIEDAGDAQARSIAAAQAEAIAQAQAMAAAATSRAEAPVFKTIKYTVQAGETLTEIAHRYGTTPQALVRLNGIAGPKMVHEGMEIYIPDDSEHVAAVKAAEEAQAKAIEAAKEKADAQEKVIAAVKAAALERGQKA